MTKVMITKPKFKLEGARESAYLRQVKWFKHFYYYYCYWTYKYYYTYSYNYTLQQRKKREKKEPEIVSPSIWHHYQNMVPQR